MVHHLVVVVAVGVVEMKIGLVEKSLEKFVQRKLGQNLEIEMVGMVWRKLVGKLGLVQQH